MPPISPVKRLDGYTFRAFPVTAGQTYPSGSPLLRNVETGAVAVTGANPALIAGFSTSSVADYAWQADTFLTVTPRPPVALADQEFRGTAIGTYAGATMLGASYGLTVAAGGAGLPEVPDGGWYVDLAKVIGGGNARVTIVGVDEDVVDGTVNPTVRFVILPANRQVLS